MCFYYLIYWLKTSFSVLAWSDLIVFLELAIKVREVVEAGLARDINDCLVGMLEEMGHFFQSILNDVLHARDP